MKKELTFILSLTVFVLFTVPLNAQFTYYYNNKWGSGSINLGINTTNPLETLHVNGNVRGGSAGGALRINTASGWMDIGSQNTSWAHFNTDRLRYYFDKEIRVNTGLISSYDEDLQLRTSGTTRMTIKNSTGQVGIGTSSPASWTQLDIKKSGNAAYLRLTGTGDNWNFSGINLTSDESTDKQWEIIHRQNPLNTLVFAYNNGSQWVQSPMVIKPTGEVGIGTDAPTEKLEVNGTTKTTILEITGGSDLAESFQIRPTTNHKLLPGMVVSINPEKPGELILANTAYDSKVAGVISGANGINTGLLLSQEGSIADGEFPVSLTGRVYCYVDASKHEVEVGDFLTTSDVPGFAMKATDFQKAQGAINGVIAFPIIAP